MNNVTKVMVGVGCAFLKYFEVKDCDEVVCNLKRNGTRFKYVHSMKKYSMLLILTSVIFTQHAFSLEVSIHEEVTDFAIREITPNVPQRVIDNINFGNTNTDELISSHKLNPAELNAYHVNDARWNTRFRGADGFSKSFNLFSNTLGTAIAFAKNNPSFLGTRDVEPQQILSNFRTSLPFSPVEMSICIASADCPDVKIAGFQALIATVILAVENIDPHSNAGERLHRILDDGKNLKQQLEGKDINGFNLTRINRAIDDLSAYLAYQYLGHAFHLLQDFFAHSNFVELMNGKRGPPCNNPTLCDEALSGEPQRFDDAVMAEFLHHLRNGLDGIAFDENLMTRVMTNAQLGRFQTGYVGFLTDGFLNGPVDSMCPRELPRDFEYCHWANASTPGLNKDNNEENAAHEQNPSRANHNYARKLSQFATEIVWDYFLHKAKLNLENLPSIVQTTLLPFGEPSAQNDGRGRSRIELRLSMPLSMWASFDYRIGSIGDATGGESCTAEGVDFINASGTATVEAGQRFVRLPVVICNDNIVEAVEEFAVVIRNAKFIQGLSREIRVSIADVDVYPRPILSEIILSKGPGNLGAVKEIRRGSTFLVIGENFTSKSKVILRKKSNVVRLKKSNIAFRNKQLESVPSNEKDDFIPKIEFISPKKLSVTLIPFNSFPLVAENFVEPLVPINGSALSEGEYVIFIRNPQPGGGDSAFKNIKVVDSFLKNLNIKKGSR